MPIDITADGIVEYQRSDGWRTTIMPGDTERAGELLTAEERAEVEAAWTPGVLRAWQAQQAAVEAELATEGPRTPTAEERLAAIEDALLSGEEADKQRVRDNVERVRGSTRER